MTIAQPTSPAAPALPGAPGATPPGGASGAPPGLMGAAQGAPPEPPTLPKGAAVMMPKGMNDGPTSPNQILAAMKIPPQFMPQFIRIVKAGMTLVLSDKTHHLLIEALQGPAPVSTKLAEGVLNLMMILNQESKGALPPNLFVPAAIYLMSKIANFINQTGLAKIAPQDIAQAMQILVHEITKRAAGQHPGAATGQSLGAGLQGGAAPSAPPGAGPGAAAPGAAPPAAPGPSGMPGGAPPPMGA